MMHLISIIVEKRKKTVPMMQEILTKYGENIHSRIGFHNVPEEEKDMIIIIYNNDNVEEFVKELKKIENIKINNMRID